MDMLEWNGFPSSWTGLKESILNPVPLSYPPHCTGPIHQHKVSPSSKSCNLASKALLLNSSVATFQVISTFYAPEPCEREDWCSAGHQYTLHLKQL
eukprot:1162117-Pelagomonas_calceolata.AAC.1